MTQQELAADLAFAPDLRNELGETFGLQFALWIRTECGWARCDDAVAGVTSDAALPIQLAEVAEPTLIPTDDGTQWLLLPIDDDCTTVLATATVIDDDADFVLRLARLFVTSFQSRQTIDRLQHENEKLVERSHDSLEELSFLRRTVEHLAASQSSASDEYPCADLLPLLQSYVHAEGVAFVPVADDARDTPDFAKLCWYGDGLVGRRDAKRLLERFHHESMQTPVLRNLFHTSPAGPDFPNVREFILLPIQQAEQTLGWLAAINRSAEFGYEENESDCRLSELEFGTVEVMLLRSAGTVIALQAHNETLVANKEQLMIDLVSALVSALESKDVYARGHSQRVAIVSQRLAQRVGMSVRACKQMYLTGLLHDIGKIGLDDATLVKPGRLTAEEFEEVKRIPQSGWAILHDLQSLGFVLPGVLHHHENYDGSGYPDALRGEEIPLEGRIIGIADAYDAMTSDRPYREGMSHEKVVEVMSDGGGKQWDPTLVALLLQMTDELAEVRNNHARGLSLV